MLIYSAINLNGTATNLYSGTFNPHQVHCEIILALILIPSPSFGAHDLKFQKSFDIRKSVTGTTGLYPLSSFDILVKVNSLAVRRKIQSCRSTLKKRVILHTLRCFDTNLTMFTILVQICIKSFATMGDLTES